MQFTRPVSESSNSLAPIEHLPLDDNRYVADVLYEMKNSKHREGQSKLLFKKRMFRETDETITEPQFVNLSYVQVTLQPHLHIQAQLPGIEISVILSPM